MGTVTSQLWILYTSTEASHTPVQTHTHSSKTQKGQSLMSTIQRVFLNIKWQHGWQLPDLHTFWDDVKKPGPHRGPFTARKSQTSLTCGATAGPVSLCVRTNSLSARQTYLREKTPPLTNACNCSFCTYKRSQRSGDQSWFHCLKSCCWIENAGGLFALLRWIIFVR